MDIMERAMSIGIPVVINLGAIYLNSKQQSTKFSTTVALQVAALQQEIAKIHKDLAHIQATYTPTERLVSDNALRDQILQKTLENLRLQFENMGREMRDIRHDVRNASDLRVMMSYLGVKAPPPSE